MREVRGLIPRISTTFFVIKNSKVWVEREMKFSNPFDIFIFFKKENKLYNTRCLSLSQYSVTTHKTTFHLLLWTECERERERERERESVSALPISSHPKNHNHMARIKHPAHKNPNRKKLSGSLSLSLFLLYMSVCINFFLGFWFFLFQIAPQEEEGPQHLLQEP